MGVQVRTNNNFDRVRSQMRGNIKKALIAIGVEAVHLVLNKMQSGYGKPIRKTGDLMRDVAYEVDRSGADTVDIGNSLEYAPFVHEGTQRMCGRAYIRDALNEGGDALQNVAANALRENMD